MPNPITRRQFDQAKRLLQRDKLRDKITNREVSARSGLSLRTVESIATGKLKRPPPEQKPRQPRMHDGVEFVIVQAYKCPGCHNAVTLSPCLICHERAKREAKT